jgi:hypothetical protein
MPLGDLQRALGALVSARAAAARPGAGPAGSFDRLDLTDGERSWLDQLAGSPGFEVTCLIQRWWRETRLRWVVRLTLAVLGADGSSEAINDYLRSTRCSSLFFVPEALGFLDFVIREGPDAPHLGAVARFERAMLKAAEAAPGPPRGTAEVAVTPRAQRVRPHPAAAVVEFAAPPERLFGALLAGDPVPPPDGPASPVLVAPGLPHLWRPATPDEALLFARCQPSATAERLLAAVAGAERPLRDLLGLGALCVDR